MTLTTQQVMDAIADCLSDDLLSRAWRNCAGSKNPVEGHCAIASEAFYHLAGGKDAGFVPVVCGYNVDKLGNMFFGGPVEGITRETHWWVRGPKGNMRGAGDIIDITASQYDKPFPYHRGQNTGFMQPQRLPSRRAQILIERVTLRFGASKLIKFKNSNIQKYQHQLKNNFKKSM